MLTLYISNIHASNIQFTHELVTRAETFCTVGGQVLYHFQIIKLVVKVFFHAQKEDVMR
jgi:hypothetical protein